MHKTLSINLGGLFFHIAEDAFEQLDAYFTSLHRYFDDNNGNEIVTDIEARVAEMFTDTLQSQRRQVIMADDVKKVIAVMGHPEELASDNLNTVADTTTPNIPNTGSQNTSAASESSANNSNDTANPNYKTTNNNEQTEQQQATSSFASRRLYRNPDDTIVGGVCSGIAAYAGISDPLWIRLAFVAASVLGGMSFMFYILLMVIIPKAKTPAQKLAMRGKPINVSSIEQAFKQGVNTLNNAIDEFNEGETGQRTRQFFHNFRAQAQAKAKNINYERGIRLFAKIIAIIIVGSILLGLVSAFVGVLSALAYSFSFLNNFVFDSFAQLVISSISLLAVFGIPVLLVGYLIFKRSFRVRSRYHWGRIMVGIWLLSLLSLLVTGGNTYRTEFAHKANFNDALPITKMANNQTLALQLQPDDRNMNALMDWEFGPSNGLVSFDTENKALYFTFPDISIKKSDNAELSFSKAVSAQGGTTNEAAENAQSIIPMFSQTDSVLSFKPYYQTAPGQKWRNQTMTYVLNIPVGQQIFIDKNLADYIWDIDLAPGYRHRQLSGNIWKMTPNGLALLSGDKTNGNENSASAGNIPNIEAINLSALAPKKLMILPILI
ncbi:MAG: PspC domain-containing protein [Sphingobacteriales bacterium]|nr:PspC domain-containing protein [Sphingobacteriales bacterium]